MTLKDEKGEDIQIAELASERGVVLFLVPKADTRESMLACSYSTHMALKMFTMQPAVRLRRADSAISILILPLWISAYTV